MYILITSVVLVFLNLYAADTTRNLVFRNKHASLEDKVQLAASALSENRNLVRDRAEQVMNQMGSLNATRILVTDEAGLVIYDTMEADSAQGRYALLPELVLALEGNDVFYSAYASGSLESRAATPILYGNVLIGAVYLMEYDTDLGGLIYALQQTILVISLVLEVAVILASLVFSEIFSRRMRKIFSFIRIIRGGDYSHKMQIRGRDELAVLAREFNELAERLQASENQRRQFVSDASHELKTPLTSIKLLSDSILQNQMDEGTIREFVGDIGNEADRLTRMSQKLLSLTKMDAGKREKLELVDIGATADKVLRMLTPVARLNDITLENKVPDGATVLMGEDDLYQILFNLAENGIKYNRPGGSLTVDLARRGESYVLSVTDTGVGIPEESIPYIFDRFYRVDKARSRQAGGSGLGLSIVHDMVLRNDGSISVTQVPGGGSCFTVVFPAFDREEETQ
ncbi:MAG: HAMP domain-containing sensor histidine kinase [Candidatus Faecousia sp.]|nr:HAMP domain-containing histidine kinase [Clostridiales bacterium]MDD7651035.1 HAMP domain-containing sensor histidine kinase [Bacillota bacterium]MDY4220367.1 HAMP domain-containing sensor histidine kinase [Candidatus Faecousia sp.]